MLDVAVSYSRFKFIGHEFLTWVWFVIENDPGLLEKIPEVEGRLEIGNRIVFENRSGNDVKESVTIKGDDAGLEEGVLSIRKGAWVTELNLCHRWGERVWQFTLRGESFHITQLKLPEIRAEGASPDPETVVLEKAALCENIFSLVDALFDIFVRIRISSRWEKETLPKMERWVAGWDGAASVE